MKTKILLVTPPFTQLNTPYPATAYLKGFLNTKAIDSVQADLGIEAILKLFSKQGLTDLFHFQSLNSDKNSSDNSKRIVALRDEYITTIDAVIAFLQGKNPTLAFQICQEDFLPEASRFNQIDDLEWGFGMIGIQDKAKHLATLYLEDISDFIIECVDENFGFSRYAERLGRSMNSFDELYQALLQKPTYIDDILLSILKQKIELVQPTAFLITVPFPGNLYAAFRSARWVKSHYPDIKIVMGGGFANTELRSLSDKRVFEFFDYITLDDGELPIELLIENLESKKEEYKRTFLLENERVVYKNNSLRTDYKQAQIGTPDYADLPLDKYISVIEILNPMHRLWSDGRWNKLTMAHGCYWGKCTFCDISLDYIKVYDPIAAKVLCDRIETMIEQTGETGFHFVDEAAPPALMRELALEILRRKLVVTWWTNIRFEKNFTKDLCLLLKQSGCIAVSGGLEVASNRLLELINKGVTVEQVAVVVRNFTESGIMVHSYLMYGYPTQTIQETIDSLEMVRQFFEAGILQSGFWHQFAMTAHSPVGMYPDRFNVKKEQNQIGTFANNDLTYTDSTGINHDKFSFGLKKALLNFMHGICIENDLQSWFDFKIPKTKVKPDFICKAIEDKNDFYIKPNAKLVWLGVNPKISFFSKKKKEQVFQMASLTFYDKKETFTLQLNQEEGKWLVKVLARLAVDNLRISNFDEIKNDFETDLNDFELFWHSKSIQKLRNKGLLMI